jgi:Transposase DDE domain
LRLYTYSYTERVTKYRADPESCRACPLKPGCTPGAGGRMLMRSFDEEFLERVVAYRETEPYRKALRKRRVWVESLFSEAKEWHGMRRFRLRGLKKVNSEALMIASGQNLKRLVAFGRRLPRKKAMVAALRPPEKPTPCPMRRHRLRPARRFSTRCYLPRRWVNSAMANPSACRPSPRRPPRRSAPPAAKRTPSCRRSTERVARERPDRCRCRAVTLTWGSTLLNVPPAARPCPARRGAAWPRRPPGHALGGTPRRRRA